ncbi:hypothetical protein [Streptomyces ossamyceticus]|jgi:hypothetical protein|uniref:hypothetical protein n=1 Tax=Streptomyces ossamyceticus TaxID=249581 RepID=UPI0006E45341|nr:hypothetical protein [Streptomyces ossamyceticus]
MTSFDLVSAVEDVRSHAMAALHARAWLIVPTDEREARLRLALPHGDAAALGELVPGHRPDPAVPQMRKGCTTTT